MKLTSKILLLLVLVVVLVTLVAGTISIRSAYADLQQRQKQLTEHLADEIQERLTNAWRRAGPRGVDRALHDWVEETKQPLLLEFVLFDSRDADLMPRVPRSVWPVLQRGQIFSLVSQDSEGGRALHTYLPLENWAGELGALELTQPLTELDQQVRQLVIGTILAMTASALFGLAVAYAAGMRWVARPLSALIAHTQKIGDGDFTARTELRSGDELDQLAQSLNSMSQHLADQQATIVRETQERMQAMEQLRHAERLGTLGRMAAGLAHELGTPLNVVAGRAALIASGKLSNDEVTTSAQTIKAEADRITKIVQCMLDFARQRRPHTAPCDLLGLVRRTLHLLESMAEKKQLSIELAMAGHPISLHDDDTQADVESRESESRESASSISTVCLIDEAQIQQVLTNLIVNAIHATPVDGRVKLSIDRAAADGIDYLRVVVEDSGPGVPEELRQRIFEPFFTTKDVGEGTGLGLSIAYGIVQEHHGRLEVSTSDMAGARFELWLPQLNAEQQPV